MKQSSNRYKHSGKLTQYSSGEDDSGTEDIFTQKGFVFSNLLSRSIDVKQKRHSFSSLRHSRLRRTDSARVIQPLNKNALWHRSLVVRARLWSDGSSNSDVVDESGTVPDSEMIQKMRDLSESNEQVSSCSRNTNDPRFLFPRHGRLKKPDNRRKVLSDITKETVSDYRYQFPSYYSRDVLPLDAEVTSESDGLVDTKKTENNNSKKDNCKDEEQANGLPTRTRSTLSNSVDMSKEFKTTEEKDWFSLHYQKVSMILVIIVLLFFFGLGLIYLNVRFKDVQKNPAEERGIKYPLCGSDNYQVPCIKEDQLTSVISLVKLLTPQLEEIASDSLCNKSGNGSLMTMSDTDVLTYIQNEHYMNPEEAKTLLIRLKLLVLSNPQWDVTVVQDHSVDDVDNEKNSKSIINDNLLKHGRLASRSPFIPFSCQLKLWYRKFLTWISSPVAVCIAVVGVLFGLSDYKRRCEQHRQEVYALVNRIINMVRNHQKCMQITGANGNPSISVESCQNEIIGVLPSKYLVSAWEEAVRFIDVNESRIVTEVLTVHGKPIKVWQWLCTTPQFSAIGSKPSKSTNQTPEESDNAPTIAPVTPARPSSLLSKKCRRTKVWQGQAFETIAGSPNSLPCSPFPCLKIRHMFDPDLEHGDDWPVLIQDSILEKCEDVCVLHIFVDCSSQEGCVFIKCSSSEEAGKAYRALHGWWFDTKLVTVKYLRTERYHERFPEAINASNPLRPSNNQCLSMQQLWHFPQEST